MQSKTSTFRRGPASSLLLVAAIMLGACATNAPYAPERLKPPDELAGVQTKTVDDVTVSAAILTDDQAQTHFGADLGKEGMQALWLSVSNGSPGRLWFIRNTLDPDFYSADEAAILLKSQFSDDTFDMLRQSFRDESIRVLLRPESITEGFVFLPRKKGGRYIDVRLTSDAYEVDSRQSGSNEAERVGVATAIRELRFGFAVPLPDGDFDYERLDTARTYSGMKLPDLQAKELRDALEQLP